MMTTNNPYNPWSQGRRIKAIVGHYGSGKTEIALGLALSARTHGHPSAIVDMDIVNPFFRTAEQHELLAKSGVELIHPPYALTGVDLPVLPAEVNRVFANKELKVVLDVGGDDAGAAALGGYKRFFDQEPCDLYYVVNLYRPFSETADQIEAMLSRIAARARMKPTGLINNANLAGETRPEDVLRCQEVLLDVSRRCSVPIIMVSGLASVLNGLPADLDCPRFPIERRLVPEWMDA